mgnify:CR=1 FL=1
MSDDSDFPIDLPTILLCVLFALPLVSCFAFLMSFLSHECPTCDEYDSLNSKYSTVVREKEELERANEHMQTVINSYQLQEAQ